MSRANTLISAFAMCSAIFLSSCVTTPDSDVSGANTQKIDNQQPSDLVSEEFFRIGRLQPQVLGEGECGLFLFSGRPSPRFVFFGEAASGVGKMLINDKETIFARTEGEGEVFQLQFSQQTYRSPARGLDIVINVVPEEPRPGQEGQRIASGTLKMTSDSGWTMVMPVGGAATCSSG